LALVIDDLQYVDNATLRFLPYLLAGLGPDRVLLVAALRVEDLPPGHRVVRMLADLRRQPSVTVRELTPLTREQTDAVVAGIVGGPSPPERADLLWQRSRGNPFLVTALARAERDGVEGLPAELRDIALAHVAALPADARTVVQAVVVCGTPVPYTLLREVTGLDEERAAAAVTVACRERVLDDGPDGYCVHVGLYAEVIEAGLAPPDRVRLHERFARVLEASGAAAEQGRLARHWLAAERPRDAWRCAVRAAERARDLHRYGEVHAYWAMAVSVVERIDDPEVSTVERRRMHVDAAEAAHLSGDHEAALRILDVLGSTLPRPLPSWWHLMRARVLTRSERPREALAEYEYARRGADDCPPEERAKATAHLADLMVQLGHYTAAQQAARRALEVVGDRRGGARTRALTALGVSQAYIDDPAAGRATLEEALVDAEKATDVILVRQRLAELLTGPLNELDRGIEVARAGADLAERSGLGRTHGARLSAVAAAGLFRAGRWAEAAGVIEAALEYTPSGADAVELLLGRATVALARGEPHRVERDLDAVEALTAGGGSVRHVLPLFTLRAGLALWRGRPGEAADAVHTGLSRWERQTEDLEMRAVLVWHGLRAAAEAAVRQGRPTDPDGRLDSLLEAVRELTTDSRAAAAPVREAVDGYLALCDAELSRVTGRHGVKRWDRVIALWQRRRHPYPEAYARLRLAEARFIAGPARNPEAVGSLREAYRMAVDLGAEPLVAAVRAVAARVRVDLDPPAPGAAAPRRRRPADAGPLAALTGRETQVLALAAEGHSNAEIAARLFISPKTVGVHLSNVFHKLGVTNRHQAGNIYREVRPP
jgi:DNA-binding NarL/FixJ family response regulator